MGRHGAPQRRRGVAGWLVAAVAAVVVLAVAIVVFVVISHDNSASAACTSTVELSVASSDDVSPAVTAAAQSFDQTHPVIRSACVTTKVTAQPDSRTATGLVSGSGGDVAPALWVADSTTSITAVSRSDGALVAGRSTTPIATSPVVLAVRKADAPAFSADPAWSALDTLAGSVKPSSGAFTVALPDPSANLAVSYALQSVVAGQSGNSAPVTSAQIGGAASILSRLGSTAAANAPSSVGDGLAALSSGQAGFTAVPAFESQVAAQTGSALAAVYPSGADVTAQVFVVPVTASWVNETDQAAAAAFSAYLDDKAGRQVLADHGLRVPNVTPASSLPGVDLGTAVAAATPAAGLDAVLAAAVGAPGAPSSTTPSSSSVQSVPPISSSVASSTPPAGTSPPSSTTSGPGSTTGSSSTGSPATTGSTGTSGTSGTTSSTSTTASTPAAPTGPVVTFLIDASDTMSTQVAGHSRLDWVKSAVDAYIARLPDSDAGLYQVATTVGAAGYDQLVTTGPLTAKSGTGNRAHALIQQLNDFTAGGQCWSYGALQTAYARAAQTPTANRKNYVVLITASPDATPGLPRGTLLSSLSFSAANASTPVVLDVVGLSDGVSSDAMTQIAQAGGGTYTQLTADQLDGWLNDPQHLG